MIYRTVGSFFQNVPLDCLSGVLFARLLGMNEWIDGWMDGKNETAQPRAACLSCPHIFEAPILETLCDNDNVLAEEKFCPL